MTKRIKRGRGARDIDTDYVERRKDWLTET